MRMATPAAVRAECAARAARIEAHFAGVDAQLQATHAKFAADGLFRPITSRSRAGDPPRGRA